MVKILTSGALVAFLMTGCVYTQSKNIISYQKVNVEKEKVMSVKSSLELEVKDGLIVGQVISDKKVPVSVENKVLVREKGVEGMYTEKYDDSAEKVDNVYVLNENQKMIASVSIDSAIIFADDTTANDTMTISTDETGRFVYDVTQNLSPENVKEAKLVFKVVEDGKALSKTYKIVLNADQIQELIIQKNSENEIKESVSTDTAEVQASMEAVAETAEMTDPDPQDGIGEEEVQTSTETAVETPEMTDTDPQDGIGEAK